MTKFELLSDVEIDEHAPAAGERALERIGRIPPIVGEPVVAFEPSGDGEWGGCTVRLWLATGDGQYLEFAIIGGP